MKKLMSILGAMLFVSGLLTSCGGVDACSCIKDAEEIGKSMAEDGADLEALQADLEELAKECEEAAKDDPEGWAKAASEC